MHPVVETRNLELDELTQILNKENINTLFQPIVSLQNGEVFGYEALSRGPKGSILQFPDRLFDAAKKYSRSWDLEYLCRKKAIERSITLPDRSYLFLNVDPNIFHDVHFQRGLTKELLQQSSITLNQIIFEITESSAIKDYTNFQKTIKNYVDQGYKIAIDDTGSGYSGLKLLTDIRPHFVKIDMELIRDIDQDGFKQTLLECFVKLAKVTNMKLIAEGIETEAELKTIISLGVHYGQGYLLGQPQEQFQEINPILKEQIISESNLNLNQFTLYNTNFIGELAKVTTSYVSTTSCEEIRNYLDVHQLPGISLTKDGVPVGLMMRHKIDSSLSSRYGYAIYNKRPVSLIMDSSPLIFDYETPILEVVKVAMERPNDSLYDSIIVTKNKTYFGIVAIKELLDFSTTMRYNYARELNPLTGLPGNLIIHQVMKDNIYSKKQCYILYVDIDYFKIYNDNYGFEKGDSILRYTGNLLVEVSKKLLPPGTFVGHIGGDDFICVGEMTNEQCISFNQEIIRRFDQDIKQYFSEEDINNGYIHSSYRNAIRETFPLTTISIAAVSVHLEQFQHYEEITTYVAKIKKKAKKIKQSCYIIEQLNKN